MATYQIGNRKTTFTPTDADSTYILGKGKLIDSGTSGIQETTGLQNLEFEIAGKIVAVDQALRIGDDLSPATGLSIEVSRSGRLISQTRGIDVDAVGFEIENLGRISGVSGIRASGKDGVIDNDGTVTATGAGIIASGEIGVRNAGTIVGDDYGVIFNATEDGTGSLRNTGTIEGALVAVMGAAGDDRIVNGGTIEGDVSLRDGADTFVLKGGKVTGEINGGDGDDRFVIHAQGATISEFTGEGFDFVKASVSFTIGANIEQLNLIGRADVDGTGNGQDNHIQGNAGKNDLRGEGGTDFLVGLAGNDRLFGGDGADYFNFQKGSGKDAVMDFEAGIDEIQIGGLKGAKGFDDMLANHLTDKGDDLWITYGGDVVVLKNTEIGDLLTGDFVFG